MASLVTGIILAAGLSRRMGEENKLTRKWRGKALVTYVAEAALKSRLDRILVITGHQRDAVTAELPAAVESVENADFASGMASSLRTGVRAANNSDGVMVLLGDMPLIESGHIDEMLNAFVLEGSGSIVQASSDSGPGNPVLFSKVYFPKLIKLQGDEGAKALIKANRSSVRSVNIGEAALRDFDVPEAFEG